jgi:hypothetical protein
MGPSLLESIANRLCSHQFAWPRRKADGEYYQVCVHCGAEYNYDWATMTRTDRVESHPSTAETGSTQPRVRRPTNWVPRARRLKVNVPMTYRLPGEEQWQQATILNISKSGLLFEATQLLRHNCGIEMIFEMPEEITGQANTRVLCEGYIARVSFPKGSSTARTAAAISEYTFLRNDE